MPKRGVLRAEPCSQAAQEDGAGDAAPGSSFWQPRQRRIDDHVERVGLEDPVGRAAVVVAAAIVVEHRHVLGRALDEAHADAERVQCARDSPSSRSATLR